MILRVFSNLNNSMLPYWMSSLYSRGIQFKKKIILLLEFSVPKRYVLV